MNDEQIKEVMRRADEIADYAWKEGLSDGANSNAKQDRECRAESRTELEAYLRTIGEPAGYSLPAGSMGEKKWAQLPKDCKPIGLVFQRIDAKTGAITEAGRVTWADWLAYPEADEPESVNAELLERISNAMQSYERHGAICMFEGSPMIYASTLTEIADIASEAQQVEKADNLVGLRGCNSRHGGRATDPCKFQARMSDAGCAGCEYRGEESQSAEAED